MLKTTAVLAAGALLAVIVALPPTSVAQPGGAQPGGAQPPGAGGPRGGFPGGGRGGGRAGGAGGFGGGAAATGIPAADNPFNTTVVQDLGEPWAMEFLPDGRLLVTDRRGELKLISSDGSSVGDVTGVPTVVYAGQGGLGDIALHPQYATNNLVYMSYAEADAEDNLSGAAVARAKLTLDSSGGGQLENVEVLWRQDPKLRGSGHYSHRIAFSPDGFMYISSGDRQGPVDATNGAQQMTGNLGKVVRLTLDGELPPDNPFADRGGVAAQIWSMGHRNLLGLTFDRSGQLWDIEMGPAGGDEINRVVKGENYGWPLVSNGSNYNGDDIPDHVTRPEFKAPAIYWAPSISPGGMIFYYGNAFPDWQGDALVAGLGATSLIRVEINGEQGIEVGRYDMGARVRGLEQAPDGTLYLIEDGGRGSMGRLLRITPK
jgi:glucose/arabinose dehydrogenase